MYLKDILTDDFTASYKPSESAQSSGSSTANVPLFIFAATMCRFIGETGWGWNPTEKLIKILEYQSEGSLI